MRVRTNRLEAFGFKTRPEPRRLGSFNGIIPYTVSGLPSGSLEIGLGALVGYLLGSQRGQGTVGALLGVAAGAVLGQVKTTAGSSATGAATGAQGYAVTKQPGVSAPGSAPDKAGSGFDWAGAAGIVNGLLSNKQLAAGVQQIATIVSSAWGSKTAQTVESAGVADSSGYLPWANENFYTDPCANGGCVLVDNKTLESNASPAEGWYPAGTEQVSQEVESDYAFFGFPRR